MRTMNLLIVDDETFVVDWLIALLGAQEDLPLHIFSCYSTAQARKILEQNKMDILLTDIRIPDGNGLDLAAFARSHWADCRILMLTAYSEFEYAQRAINSAVDGYILKTEQDDYILQRVRGVAQELDRMLDERQNALNMRYDLEHYRLLYRSSEFLHWLRGDSCSEKKLEGYIAGLGLQQARELYLVMGYVHRAENAQENLLRVRLFGQEILRESADRILVEYQEREIYFLLQPKDAYAQNFQAQLENLFGMISSSCQSVRGFKTSFVISRSISHPQELPRAYWAACRRLHGIRESDEAFLYRMQGKPESSRVVSFTAMIPSMVEMLEGEEEQPLFALIREIEASLPEGCSTQDAAFQNAYLAISMALAEYLSHLEGVSSPALDMAYTPAAHTDTAEAFDYLRSMAMGIIAESRERHLDVKQRLVREIDDFVREHAGEDILLSDISDHFNYNVDYLSRLYSSSTGVTLKKAIIRQRLHFVEGLMKNPQLSLNEIVEQAGFKSRTYFNFFIKHTLGVTPSQYRQSLRDACK